MQEKGLIHVHFKRVSDVLQCFCHLQKKYQMINFYNNVYHSGRLEVTSTNFSGGGGLPVKTTVAFLYLFELKSGFWCLASKVKSGSFRGTFHGTFHGTEPKYDIKTKIKPRHDVIYVDIFVDSMVVCHVT